MFTGPAEENFRYIMDLYAGPAYKDFVKLWNVYAGPAYGIYTGPADI